MRNHEYIERLPKETGMEISQHVDNRLEWREYYAFRNKKNNTFLLINSIIQKNLVINIVTTVVNSIMVYILDNKLKIVQQV